MSPLREKFKGRTHARVSLISRVKRYCYGCTENVLTGSHETALGLGLWCVQRLLTVSKRCERLIGADERRVTKVNGSFVRANGKNDVKLSRPLHQIIEDTFKEEILRYNQNKSNINETTINSEKTEALDETIESKHRDILQTLEKILRQSEEFQKKMRSTEETIKPDDEVRVVTLNEDEHFDRVLYRLEKNCVVQFRLGPTLFGKKVKLFCNHPNGSFGFERDCYYELKWFNESNCDDSGCYCFLRVKTSGSFRYYFTYDSNECKGSGYFLVDPVLTYGNVETLELDCIQCQTVLTKSLGKFTTWERKLRVAKESGYNMIHFTPIQALGESNSSYSIREQLELNSLFESEMSEIENFVEHLRNDWKIVSICDVVLNHTANESAWLLDHPEATYNCENCAYMRPAYLLDAALHRFGIDISQGGYETKGIPKEINHEDHLNAIRHVLHTEILPKLKLQELYICDVEKLAAEFGAQARSSPPQQKIANEKLVLIQDEGYRRLKTTVDFDLALRIYNVYRNDTFDEDTRVKKCTESFKAKLDELNGALIEALDANLKSAVENCISSIRYFRLQADGPKLKEVTLKTPLLDRYFTDFGKPDDFAEHERIMFSPNGRYLMAHNGWVMNSDPLRNFASDSGVYVRRELIAWGDSVKLRYGNSPDESPFLWRHMRRYVESTVQIFDGVRLDNCHSTPVHVAEYLLDCARKIKPDLYVVAELFTNSDETDNIFVNRLGITSLIREGLSAWDSHELGRLVYRYGGHPVGAFYQSSTRPLTPSIAHALFLDQTHDNPSPVEKRSVFDLLPSAGLISMACCASGSNRGYDELVPEHIHVVDEIREYTEWSEKSESVKFVGPSTGIISAKAAFNRLHYKLGREGYTQVFVDQIDPEIVAVTRHNPITHESVILVAFTAFKHPNFDESINQRYIKPLKVSNVDKIIFEASLRHKTGSRFDKSAFTKDNRYINGLAEYVIDLREDLKVEASDMIELNEGGVRFKNFKKGSCVAIKTRLKEDERNHVVELRSQIGDLAKLKLDTSGLTLADFNRILYRCDQEERDDDKGFGVYNIPDYGPLVYCGLQGLISPLSEIRAKNDLGHPICANLRNGDWLIDYTWQRLKVHPETEKFSDQLKNSLEHLKSIPRFLIPAYFDALITRVYVNVIESVFGLMSKSNFIKNGSTFTRALALGSVQFAAKINSSPLPALSPKTSLGMSSEVSLSAGLPHFATGYTRNWGRDTFIALRGMFLLTGRYQEAKVHILAYAGCLRHGLIPNLLDGGKNARFNARDAVWWWLQSIKSYADEAPDGVSILKEYVSRLYPKDDSIAQEAGACDQILEDVIQEALNVHFQGLTFRERNAGRGIDEHMTDKGFNNQIGIHPETGFVFGGNEFNCGTWMDKMGSSERAGTRGKPATPRDGSAVELVGLSKSVISWLDVRHKAGDYRHAGVTRTGKTGGSAIAWTWSEWAEKIRTNFERCFYIGDVNGATEKRPELINKRRIYKDCYGASRAWSDYQLRCNFPIAMVFAPELFDPENAWKALETAQELLLGPLGMKTVDESDWNYNGDYENSNDSNDAKLAHGFNYHQGPEWVWPMGFYLRAKLIFGERLGRTREARAAVKEILARHFVEVQTSVWRGLPELTNRNGAYCADSSRTQAWSMSSILEVLKEIETSSN